VSAHIAADTRKIGGPVVDREREEVFGQGLVVGQ
jgi:hypothetical protein